MGEAAGLRAASATHVPALLRKGTPTAPPPATRRAPTAPPPRPALP
jgi:hypothetical protein